MKAYLFRAEVYRSPNGRRPAQQTYEQEVEFPGLLKKGQDLVVDVVELRPAVSSVGFIGCVCAFVRWSSVS